MKKSHTLLLIETSTNVKQSYYKTLEESFSTIIEAHSQKDALSFYLHYRPDVIILGTGTITEYKDFLGKVKKNLSTPTIVMTRPHEIKELSQIFDYNFTYCMVDNNFSINLYSCIKQTLQKVELIKELTEFQSLGHVSDLKMYEENINQTNVPTILCTGNIDNVRCNEAFTECFGVDQKEINQNVLTQDFLNRVELKDIIQKKDLCDEHEIIINSKKLKAKIYILKQYELYLITFNSISNENQIINLDLKKELTQILSRIDKNFDDYMKLQGDMIEITSQIRQFLHINTPDTVINQWLKQNHKAIHKIEQEFDYVILEELKMYSNLTAS